MYSKYIIPNNKQYMYRNNSNVYEIGPNGERFFLAPFLVGGLAGTALGYGIANNNQLNNNNCCGKMMPYPPPIYYQNPPYPMYTSNFYY